MSSSSYYIDLFFPLNRNQQLWFNINRRSNRDSTPDLSHYIIGYRNKPSVQSIRLNNGPNHPPAIRNTMVHDINACRVSGTPGRLRSNREYALRLMGYDTKVEVCGHCFRAMAYSSLIQSGLWS